MREMNVISRCQAAYRTAELGCPDITGAHHSFILAVCHTPGASQDELSRRLALNKSSVARALAHLEGLGYVSREQDKRDKRVIRVYPTEKMLLIYPVEKRITEEWNRAVLSGISEDEIAVFRSVLKKMEERARELCPGGKKCD